MTRAIAVDLLGIRTQMLDSRDFELTGKAGDRLLMLLQRIGATDYISGPAAQRYLDAESYAEAGVRVHWKDYNRYPEYPQLHGPYAPGLSIVDLLMNCGDDARRYIWGSETAATGSAPRAQSATDSGRDC